MELHEYQSKLRFANYGIPIPHGRIADTAEQAFEIAREIGTPVAVKSQIFTDQRKHKGGIAFAADLDEARQQSERIFGKDIRGKTVRRVLVDPLISIKHEFYLAIKLNRNLGQPVLLASVAGGDQKPDITLLSDESLIHEPIDPFLGIRGHQIINVANDLNLPREHWHSFTQIARGLYKCFIESDALYAEINPLALTLDNRLIAVDGKLNIDDNALFRHLELETMNTNNQEDEADVLAHQMGISYVPLDGTISCIANGTGVGIAMADLLQIYSDGTLCAANILDVCDPANMDRLAMAFHIATLFPRTQVILISLFDAAEENNQSVNRVVEVYNRFQPSIPIVIRHSGLSTCLDPKTSKQVYLAATLRNAIEQTILLASEDNNGHSD